MSDDIKLIRLRSADFRSKQCIIELERKCKKLSKECKKLGKINKSLEVENTRLKRRLKDLEKINRNK